MSVRQTFNQHPDAIASINRASKMPPAPWARVYIAAKLAEAIAMRTGEIGEDLCMLRFVDLDKVRDTINAARTKAATKAEWTEAGDAHDELEMLESTFASVRIGLAMKSQYENFYSIAASIAETGTAYIRSVRDAPDVPLPSNVSFIASPYRANPLVAMDTASALVYHAAGFLEELGHPLNALPEPYNLPKAFLEKIHGHGFRNIELQDCLQDKMMQCVIGLRVLNYNTEGLFRKKTIRNALKDRLDVETLLATAQYMAYSFTPPSKNQRAEHEKTLRPSATVLEFRPRG